VADAPPVAVRGRDRPPSRDVAAVVAGVPRPGLRERKKLKTRAAIQREAFRLFRERGYDQTTVEQIADAADVSPSTFFRYFPTKEAVVLYDALDPLAIAAFRAQPAELGPIPALRNALHSTFAQLSPMDRVDQMERGRLVFSVPDLRAAMLDDILRTSNLLADLIAERVGRPPDDTRVRIFTGAVLGALLAGVLPAIENPEADFVELMDAALDQVESGISL